MSLSRRHLLAGAGTALAGVIAGCSTDEEGDGEGGDENEANADPETESEVSSNPDETILGEISVENVDDQTHTIDVIVEFDGGVEHWTTHELEAGDGLDLGREWSDGAGSFRVIARLDENDPIQVNAETWNEPDCLNLLAFVDRNGDLSVLGDTDGGPCGDGDASFGG
ncbi:hypothetical protein [Natronobacterium texcoconense]|uniref:Uncharacterized protein n=1 Tax=Natronobacterium texcoconense TaxID=1095778 RepID=A0A1H1I407_NATTX|nr:hypothetical protein [Natronobacterium texcoconense]SDR32437.1 hypothetical protein SAMN04489842_3306 [Natronobacterium texcoconense]